MNDGENVVDTEKFELDKDEEEVVLDDDSESQPEEVEEPEPPKTAEPPPAKLEISVVDEKKTKKKKPREPRTTDILPQDFDIFIETLAPGSESGIYLTVTRVAPVLYKSKDIQGYINRFDEPITAQQIKELYGGGTYDIAIMGPRKQKDGTMKGNQFLSRKRMKISGNPILEVEEESKSSQKGPSDPDIVQQTLNAQSDMVKQTREDRLADEAKRDKMLELLMANKGGDDSLKSILGVVTTMMESQKATAEAQLVAAREDAKAARDEQARDRKEFREEMMRRESENKKESERAMNPMVEFMRENAKENAIRAEKASENMIKLAEIQRDNSNQVFERQINLMQESGKIRDEFLSVQLKNTMEELKDARKSSAGTLVDKLKEFKLIKSLFGNEEPDKDMIDRVGEMLPELPNIIQSFGYLFGKTPPAETAAPSPAPQITSGQPAAPAPAPKTGTPPKDKRDQMRTAVLIAKFTEEAEKAIQEGMEPEKFANEAVIGNFDTEILKKIASFPAEMLVQAVRGSAKGEDNVVKTPAGRIFLNKVYAVIKEKYSS
jgi:hypothetical protein